jgi:urocanate hydratase
MGKRSRQSLILIFFPTNLFLLLLSTHCVSHSMSNIKQQLLELRQGLAQIDPHPFDVSKRSDKVPHAPNRIIQLTPAEKKLAIANALRYIPEQYHALLAKEALQELDMYGHVYFYRFRPTSYEMKAYPLDCYPAQCKQAASIQLMIMNNLNPEVAQYPHELITYGGNGSVFSNWAQYRIVMKYLSEMTNEQTLSMYSGHPMGLFPSSPEAPRVIVTNGMVIPNYSRREDYDRGYALNYTQYGQMTAGSYCYIGPQGIVHGTCSNFKSFYTDSHDFW